MRGFFMNRLKVADGMKTQLADGMLLFSDDKLHSPLTISAGGMGPEDTKQACLNFSTIKKYMRQHNTTNLGVHVHELLAGCVGEKAMRDEFFAGLIKQCTSNPDDTEENPEKKVGAVQQAWELLALAATYFPPSEDFRDYVEAFVRRPAYARFEGQRQCAGLLSRTAYAGAGRVDVTAEGLEAACTYADKAELAAQGTRGALGLLKRYKDGCATAQLAQRSRLAEFRDPAWTAQNATWLDLKEGCYESKGGEGGGVKASKKKKAKGKMHGGWEVHKSDDGETYYYNEETGESTYDKPAGLDHHRRSMRNALMEINFGPQWVAGVRGGVGRGGV